jgi:hypothetical protein
LLLTASLRNERKPKEILMTIIDRQQRGEIIAEHCSEHIDGFLSTK